MKTKDYKKWLAALMSVVIAAGSFSGLSTVRAEEAAPMQQEAEKQEKSYVFAGNMVENPSFDNNAGWEFTGAGYASNNGHNGSGDKHFYINGGASNSLRQEVLVPYTGYYRAGLWVAAGGEGAKFKVKNMNTGEINEKVLARNSAYTQYELECWLNKGEKVEISVTGGSDWVNGDDISLEYNKSRFENMAVNSGFKTDNSWDKAGAASISDGKAVLPGAGDTITQSIYIPQTGEYYAKVTLKNAQNAKVSFAGSDGGAVNGNQEIIVKPGSLTSPGPVDLVIAGKAEVTGVEVKFDLEAMPNEAPVASDIVINGEATADLMLESSYTFADADGHTEGTSLYQWMCSDASDGSYTPLEGETGKNLLVKQEWEDKYVKIQVTPVDQYAKAGTPALSQAIGPVDVNLIKNPGFEANGDNWSEISIKNNDAYAGLVRGVVKKDTTSHQNITVSQNGYYDLSVFVRYAGTAQGKIWVEDEAGNKIADVLVEPGSGYRQVEKKGIALEKGWKVKLCLKGAADTDYDVDKFSLKRDRSRTASFMNVTDIKTNPGIFEKVIDRNAKSIQLKYLYGTDLAGITIEEVTVSEGASVSVKAGDTVNFSNPFSFTVTGSDGTIETWSVQAEMAKKKVALSSTNKYLEETFNWAAHKMDQFVMTGTSGVINKYAGSEGDRDENGNLIIKDYMPSYWAGYYDRTAFYSRDFLHQATGGQIAGLADENFSMFKSFAEGAAASRKWYTYWAINFDGSPYSLDYNSDNSFVREVPAQFELVEKAYEQYLWSGDRRYVEDEALFRFYTKVMTDYVALHDLQNPNGVAEGTANGIFSGASSYNERGDEHAIESGDSIGSQYQATLAYAGILEARRDKEGAKTWYQKAADLKTYFNEEWSVMDPADPQGQYARIINKDMGKLDGFGKENSWFLPMKLITEPGARNDAYIDFVLKNLGDGIGSPGAPTNLEAYTYIPDMLFPYNRSDDAWKWMKYITSIRDLPHERPIQGTNGDYPEISFTFVSHTIEGMMGVEPDAVQGVVTTLPRLPQEVPDVTAKYIDIGAYELELTHEGNQYSKLTNRSAKDITWTARFYGEHEYIKINGNYVKAQQEELNGNIISHASAKVKQGETVEAQAGGAPVSYVIETAQPQNGSLSVDKETAFAGEIITVTALAKTDYFVKEILVNKNKIDGNNFAMPEENVRVTALIEKIPADKYVITASAGENGTISPQGQVLVNKRETQKFTIAPNDGYQVSDIVVDGKSQGPASSYVFKKVQKSYKIEVFFEKEQQKEDGSDDSGKDEEDQKDEDDEKKQDNVKIKIETGKEAPQVKMLNSTEELMRLLGLTKEEKEAIAAGEKLAVNLKVEALKSTRDHEVIKKIMEEEQKGYQIGQYLDITLSIQVGEQKSREITETEGELKLMISVPQHLKAESGSRKFAVVRVHGKEASVLKDSDEKKETITIGTDRFSAYTIVYADVKSEDQQENGINQKTNTPVKTGDNMFMAGWILLGLLAAAVMADGRKRQKI